MSDIKIKIADIVNEFIQDNRLVNADLCNDEEEFKGLHSGLTIGGANEIVDQLEALIQEQVKEAYDRGYTDKAIKADKFLAEQIRLARIDEINSWFDMPKHYPGEEYLDQPFAKVKCKTPVRVQYQTLDSRFTYALLTRIKALKGEK
jgi:hypothetical protein